jgi:hypothetical protein
MSTSRAVACGATGLLVMLAAACSGPAPSAGRPARSTPAGHTASTPAGHTAYAQLTISEAYSAFSEFLAQFSDLSAHPADIGRLTTGPEVQVVTASDGAAPGPAVSDLTDTRILVPELTSYPRWFVGAGTESTSGQGVMFVLVQHSAGAPWQETAELYDLGDQAQILPDLAAAGFGVTATTPTVPGLRASLAMQPAQLPAAYAQYLNDRGTGTQRGEFKAGSYTTGLISLEQTASAGAPPDGWKYTDTQAAADLPQYALRLPSGDGAAVIFFTIDTATWTAMSTGARMPAATYSGLALPPLQMLQALGIKSVHAGQWISVKAVDENLAFIGPPGTKGVTIAANAGRAFRLSRG